MRHNEVYERQWNLAIIIIVHSFIHSFTFCFVTIYSHFPFFFVSRSCLTSLGHVHFIFQVYIYRSITLFMWIKFLYWKQLFFCFVLLFSGQQSFHQSINHASVHIDIRWCSLSLSLSLSLSHLPSSLDWFHWESRIPFSTPSLHIMFRNLLLFTSILYIYFFIYIFRDFYILFVTDIVIIDSNLSFWWWWYLHALDISCMRSFCF